MSMIKRILFFTFLFPTSIHSMETNSLLEITKKIFNIAYCGTNIHVTKEPLFEISDKVTMTVVGKHQQKMLHYYFVENYEDIGITYFPSSPIYQKYEKYDSDSDDDTYKPYEPCCLSDTHKYKLANSKKLKYSHLIAKIIEPCITQTTLLNGQKTYQYNVVRKNVNSVNHVAVLTFIDKTAIEEASKDLTQCYNNVLTIPIKCGPLNNCIKPTVALPPLGADIGFPRDKAAPIAITTVLKFIIKNPKAYGTIYFYVKKRSDFARYKLLLMQHTGLLYNICLFILAREHDSNIVSLLPPEIVHYITQLI